MTFKLYNTYYIKKKKTIYHLTRCVFLGKYVHLFYIIVRVVPQNEIFKN